MRRARVFFSFAAFVLAASASRASAQEVEGKFQLALSTDLLTYNSSTLSYDAFDVETSGVYWGIRESLLFELGYGVSDMIVFGALVQLGGSSRTVKAETEGGDVSMVDVAVGPKVDVLFSPDAPVRPFLSASVAFVSNSIDSDAVDSGSGTVTSQTGFNLGARLGLHWFATESLSLMPAIAFAYTSGSGEAEPDGATDTFEYDTESFDIGLMFGASGWI